MRLTWRSVGRWLAVVGLLTPGVLSAEDVHFRLGDEVPASISLAAAEEETDATYETTDPQEVLDQSELFESDILLTNNDAPVFDASELAEPIEAASMVSDMPPAGEFVEGGSCGNCCRRRTLRPYAGVAATFLAPSHNTGGGAAILTGNYATGTTNLDRSATDRQMAISPRIWLGVQGESWGAVVRYWNWNSQVGGLSEVGAAIPNAGTAGLFTQNYLRLQTLDAEVTRYLHAYRSDMWFSFGFRYAAFQRGSGLVNISRVGTVPTLISSTAMESTNFYGGGLTMGLFGKTPIRGTNLSWVYSGRSSVIWDPSSKSLAFTDVTYGSNGGGAFNNFSGGTNSAFSTLFQSEVQLGLQYDRALRFIPANAFFRGAFEWQYWNLNHGNSQNASASGGTSPGALPLGGFATAISRASGTTLDMLGFNLATGFNW